MTASDPHSLAMRRRPGRPMGGLWAIDTLAEEPGLTARVRTGSEVDAKSVQIRNLGGFTGNFWEGMTGDATADLGQKTFTIAGVAEGFYSDEPKSDPPRPSVSPQTVDAA